MTKKNQADPNPASASWKRKRSMLTSRLAQPVLKRAGVEANSPDPTKDSEHFDSHPFVVRARRVSYQDLVSERLSVRLRPISEDDQHGDPIVAVMSGGGLPDGDGNEVWVKGVVKVERVFTVQPGLPSNNEPGEAEAWRAKWPATEPNYDERDVVGPIWEELEMPGYLIPNLKFADDHDWSAPLEYGMATMPEFTFILPMDEAGKRFGHDDHYIYSWGDPQPPSKRLSSAENERRKVTVRFRYRVVGWTQGWRDDHSKLWQTVGPAN